VKARERAFSSRSGFTLHTSDTSVALIAEGPRSRAKPFPIDERQDRLAAVPRERPATPATRDAFTREVASPSCSPVPVSGRRAPGPALFRPVALPPTGRPSSLLRAHATSARRFFLAARGFTCALDPVCVSRYSVRKGSTRRFSGSGDACRFLQRYDTRAHPSDERSNLHPERDRDLFRARRAVAHPAGERQPVRRERRPVPAETARAKAGHEARSPSRSHSRAPESSARTFAGPGEPRNETRRSRPTASPAPRRATD